METLPAGVPDLRGKSLKPEDAASGPREHALRGLSSSMGLGKVQEWTPHMFSKLLSRNLN